MMFIAALLLAVPTADAVELPKVKNVEFQPLAAQAKRVVEALSLLGSPLSEADKKELAAAKNVEQIQAVLDKHCLADVKIGKDGAKLTLQTLAGPTVAEVAEQGWRVFLVKVENPQGVEGAELRPESPNALPLFSRSTGKPDPIVVPVSEVSKRFLELGMFNTQPLVRDLSGLEVEYRILQVYCRDPGRKDALLGFSLWKDADTKARARAAESNQVRVLFESTPAVVVELKVKDVDGQPAMASFIFRDNLGRTYPSQSRRLAPDLGFHPQVYRGDGETVLLQPGKYTVTYTRGPEYRVLQKEIAVPAAKQHTEPFALERWVFPRKQGWYSGDHHVHAAGCGHYESPTEGVTPEDMMRHVLGEDLNVGCCLSWGPCWYHQKRYFEGKVNKLSTANHLLRYDVEVSGFPSSHCGHICLLRLREQDYPGTKLIPDWPSWDLPIFQWAKAQGSVTGFAHSGWGLMPEKPTDPTADQLPNYLMPRMDGIGANEYLVDVALGACDFISTVDTPPMWELNIWYHTLNCGYRCRISGETDFPCIYGEKVGLGRSYVHLAGALNFDDWAEGIKQGRCYVSDGKSHLMDFSVNGLGVGLKKSEIQLERPGTVKVKATVAALLAPKPTPETEKIRYGPTAAEKRVSYTAKPYWDLEKARIGEGRKVPVEVVVNGVAVAKKEISADGTEQEVTFDVPIAQSSWVCLRVLPSSHTNPVFVNVAGKPIRVSKKSADWCLQAIDKCWEQKRKGIRAGELDAAKAAYEKAKEEYKRILAESVGE